jgi:orotate phosphoribosyltransferase
MESKVFKVSLEKNPRISMEVIAGHFTTRNAHISHYHDVSSMKSNALVARDVARELALPYLTSKPVDTIVCMENTKVIGAYLAEELLHEGTSVINEGGEIFIVTPMTNTAGQLIFYDNEITWITNRSILLLTATVSSGRTLYGVLECINYYGGKIAGISALFLASHEKQIKEVNALFTSDDIEGYRLYFPNECEMCKEGQKLDAIVSSEGYSKLL